MNALPAKKIKESLTLVPAWSKQRQVLRRTFQFEDFPKGIAFVNQVAKRAQKLNHHPDIDIRFDQIKLTLTTHDAGGLTEADFKLARQCDEIYLKS